MVEESQLAVQQGTPNPICDSYQETSLSYDGNLSHVIQNMSPSCELLIASHNEASCDLAFQQMTARGLERHQVFFGQLKGLSDEVTFSLMDRGLTVYKYVPYGPTDIMIPYLCRRAVESFQMMANINIQISYIR